jgi:hypothetical protein
MNVQEAEARRLVGAHAGAGQLSGAVQAMPPLPQITLFPSLTRVCTLIRYHTIHGTIHTTRYYIHTDDEKTTTMMYDETQNLSGVEVAVEVEVN